jgi:UDP-glucose 4-epimerase
MRVLVTGAFGFIGTAVARRLTSAEHEVVALTHRPSEVPAPAWWTGEVVHADVRDARAVLAAVANVDAVCHLAALSLVRESFERPAEYFQVNATGTRTLVSALTTKAAKSGRPVPFVHASTHAVYGAPERQPITEDTPLTPMSPYGQSKVDAEDALVVGSRTGALNVVCLRLFNVAGAVAGLTDKEMTRIIPKTLAVAAGRASVLEINGDGCAIRDFVHVEDVADAFLLALAACRQDTYAVYNVGGTAASIIDVVIATKQITGRPIPIIHNPHKAEPPVIIADTTRIKSELSWMPERSSLTQIVADAWEVILHET